VVLACGAWRDRPLPIEGADAYLGKGLVYQNAFVIAFNHAERGDLPNARYEVLPGAVIVGGGLASIDVAKIHTLEATVRELAKRGIKTDVVELEVKGIPKILSGHGLAFGDLGIVPPTIYYRRRVEDMPLMSAPEDADAEAPPLDALLPPLAPLLLPPEDAAPPPRPSVVTAREHAPRRAAPMANSQRTRPS
jgi:hypothetical protein